MMNGKAETPEICYVPVGQGHWEQPQHGSKGDNDSVQPLPGGEGTLFLIPVAANVKSIHAVLQTEGYRWAFLGTGQ